MLQWLGSEIYITAGSAIVLEKLGSVSIIPHCKPMLWGPDL